MGGILLRLRSWWDGADGTQRTVALVGGGFLALMVVATYLFASKPHMGLLASGLSGADQGTVIQELQKQGIPYEMEANGSISVPQDRVPEIRAKLMMAGKLTASNSGGLDESLKGLGIMTTPRVEREALRAIAEGKLSQTISQLDGVESATVHLALGDDSPFVDKKPTTASITVREKAGSTITKEQARGIGMLVAGSVPGLDPSGVTVLNGSGVPLVDPMDQSSSGSKVANKLDTERLEARRRERDIQSKLDTVFGPGNTIATVDLEIDFKGEKYDQVQHTPSGTQTTAETTESMTNGGSPVGSASGAGANAGAPPAGTPTPGQTTQGNGYTNKTKQLESQWDDKHTTGEDPAGKIKSMTISVMANDKVADADVQAMLDNYLGARKADPAFSAKVTKTKFDTSAATAAAAASKTAASGEMMQRIFSLIPILALVGVAIMVIKAISKFAKTQTLVLATPDGKVLPLPAGGLNLSPEAIAASGGSVEIARSQAKALTSSAASAPRPKRPNEPEEEDLEIDAIKRKINVPLEQIKKMSDDRPEVVAMLIKSWLMEERR